MTATVPVSAAPAARSAKRVTPFDASTWIRRAIEAGRKPYAQHYLDDTQTLWLCHEKIDTDRDPPALEREERGLVIDELQRMGRYTVVWHIWQCRCRPTARSREGMDARCEKAGTDHHIKLHYAALAKRRASPLRDIEL